MKAVFRCLRWCLLLLVLALPAALLLALQTAPLVPPPAPISAADVARARDFLRRNDPRQAPAGSLRAAQIGEADIRLLLDYLSSRYPAATARLQLQEQGQAHVALSLALGGPFWLNAQAHLVQNGGLPQLQDLRLGRLPVPDWLTAWLREQGLRRLEAQEEARLLRQMIKHVALLPGQVQLLYEWQPDSYRRMLEVLVPAPEQARLHFYQEQLARLFPAQRGSLSLAAALPPLFALAAERSLGADTARAAAENRALLLVLAAEATGRGLGAVLPAARAWPRTGLELRLHERGDFPMHWLVSAALAAHAGGPLADAVGIYKEFADTRDGSGFSFNDIAADRAGSRLGQLAVAQPHRVQQRLAAGVTELELLPDISDLPEYLSAAEFRQHYGSAGSPAYRAMMDKIEQRLDAQALLR